MIFSHDGHSIDYELLGTGPTIVLLHGLTVDRRGMRARSAGRSGDFPHSGDDWPGCAIDLIEIILQLLEH